MISNDLTCTDLIKTYGGGFTLGPVTLELEAGVTCLVGANGAGKSTLFRLIAGVDRPTSGKVALPGGPGARRLGYLPQDPTLPQSATCEDFLMYVAWLHQVPRSARRDAIAVVLKYVGLANRAQVKIKTLSGGMQRRLGIAHALVHDPAVVLLDEPTSGLDPTQRIALRENVRTIGRDRVVLVSTHLVEDVRAFADRVIVLRDGAIVFDGDVQGLESLAAPIGAGSTDLERALSGLIGVES